MSFSTEVTVGLKNLAAARFGEAIGTFETVLAMPVAKQPPGIGVTLFCQCRTPE